MENVIILKDMHFFAYHGVLSQESVMGNEYVVNLSLKVDVSRAMETDKVSDTVDYAEVFQVVKAEMLQPSKLIEHVAGRIAKRLLNDFPLISSVDIMLEKLNPPMNADMHSAAIRLVLP